MRPLSCSSSWSLSRAWVKPRSAEETSTGRGGLKDTLSTEAPQNRWRRAYAALVSKEDTRRQHHSAQILYVVQPGQTGVRHTPWPSPSTAMRPGALEKAIASISRYSEESMKPTAKNTAIATNTKETRNHLNNGASKRCQTLQSTAPRQ